MKGAAARLDVDELAGMIPPIAAHWRGRFKRLDTVETEAIEDAADGCRRDAQIGSDLLPGEALPPKDFPLRPGDKLAPEEWRKQGAWDAADFSEKLSWVLLAVGLDGRRSMDRAISSRQSG